MDLLFQSIQLINRKFTVITNLSTWRCSFHSVAWFLTPEFVHGCLFCWFMTRSFRTSLSVRPLAARTFSFWNFGELIFSHWASWSLHSASPFASAVTILQFRDRFSAVTSAQDSSPFEPADFPILWLCPRNALQPGTVSLTCPCWCFYFPPLRIGS